jgi:hypothetical protein
MPTSVGPDGIDVTGYGWTNQSTQFNSNDSLYSYGSPNSSLYNPAAQNGYGAQSILVQDAIASPTHATTGYITRIFIPASFTCGHADIFVASSTTSTFLVGLWSSSALNGTATPLVWSASTAFGAGPIMGTVTWNGTSSPTSVNLTGGSFYYIYTYSATASTTVGASTMAGAGMANAHLASTTYDTLTMGTPLTSLSATSALTNTLTASATKIWVGLRA